MHTTFLYMASWALNTNDRARYATVNEGIKPLPYSANTVCVVRGTQEARHSMAETFQALATTFDAGISSYGAA